MDAMLKAESGASSELPQLRRHHTLPPPSRVNARPFAGRELRQRKVGEHNVPAQYVYAQIGVNEHERDRCRKRIKEEGNRVA